MDSAALLSWRESQIAALVATGASNKEIARLLALSTKTVKNVLTKVFVKTQTRSRTELAVHLVHKQYSTVAAEDRAPVPSSRARRGTIRKRS